MIEMEETKNLTATPAFKTRRVEKKSILARLARGAMLVLYVPVVFVARSLLTAARIHGEAKSISIARNDIALPQLPAVFDGLTIAFLSDLHCGEQTTPAFLERVVDETNRLKPDLILLGGDYVTEGTEHIRPVGKLLSRLHAPLGTYGVLGNHDFYADATAVRTALKRAGVVVVDNSGRWLTRGDSRLRIAGVGDLWEDVPDLSAALAGAGPNDAVILLSHNPDYAMEITDPRVGLVLSGHTHGGQIQLPRVGALITNSRYGRRLANGLTRLHTFQLYVSRGLGTVMLPFRYNCPPEIAFLTLRQDTAGE